MLDAVLLVCLLVLLPAGMFWRSLARRGRPAPPKIRRYLESSLMVLALNGLLAAAWLSAGRGATALGLGLPVSPRGLVGLGVAVVLLMVFSTMLWIPGKAAKPAAGDGGKGGGDDALLPATPGERAAFLPTTLILGCGWEILYRGYLLWALAPHLGTAGAVLVAALAYGVAHGYKTARLFAGSLVSALVFTACYALTGSLWWLMAVHSALPLLGALAAWRVRRGAPVAAA